MKNVLVVVDMQNDFIDRALGTKKAVQIVPEVINAIQDESYDTVIATMDTHSEDYLKTREGKYLPVKHCIKDTKGWQLNEEVKQALEKRHARIIEKPTFGSLTLQKLLAQEKPERIVFTGLCTDICVIANACLVKAALYESDICVKEKATAGVTEQKKEAALEIMRSQQIEIL